jgi:hypothetical protein
MSTAGYAVIMTTPFELITLLPAYLPTADESDAYKAKI